jgi:hypothetical protein
MSRHNVETVMPNEHPCISDCVEPHPMDLPLGTLQPLSHSKRWRSRPLSGQQGNKSVKPIGTSVYFAHLGWPATEPISCSWHPHSLRSLGPPIIYRLEATTWPIIDCNFQPGVQDAGNTSVQAIKRLNMTSSPLLLCSGIPDPLCLIESQLSLP